MFISNDFRSFLAFSDTNDDYRERTKEGGQRIIPLDDATREYLLEKFLQRAEEKHGERYDDLRSLAAYRREESSGLKDYEKSPSLAEAYHSDYESPAFKAYQRRKSQKNRERKDSRPLADEVRSSGGYDYKRQPTIFREGYDI